MGIEPSDKSVFDAVYEEHAETIYRIALHYSNDHHAAEDITQKAFMALYTSREIVEPDCYVSWLKRTAKNLALNYNKHSEHEIQYNIDDMKSMIDSKEAEDNIEEFLGTSTFMEWQIILYMDLAEKIRNEKPCWYDLFVYTYVLKKSSKEIADIMGSSVGKIRVMLHRMRKWIEKRDPEAWDHLDKA